MAPTRTQSDRVLLAGIVFIVLFAQVLLYPGLPDLVSALGATTTINPSTWFLATEFAAFIAFASLWGAASDTTGKRLPYIGASAILGALGYFTIATTAHLDIISFTGVLLLRGLQGAATIGAFSLAMTMLMDLPGGHGQNMGATGIAIGLGTALGSPVGGVLTGIDPLYPLYAAAALLAIVAPLTLVVSDRAPQGDRTAIREVLATLTDTPELGYPYVFGFIDRLSAGFFALAGTLYFRTIFELDATMTGVMLALFFAPFALLQYPFGILSDRIGRTIPVLGGSICYGFTVIGVGLAGSVPTAGLFMFLAGVVGAFMTPATMALVTDTATPTQRGTAMGGFNIFGSLGFLVGIIAGGLIADTYGFLPAFLVVGALEICIALGVITLYRPGQLGS